MVFILTPEDSEKIIVAKIKLFLKTNGLNISQKNTKITTPTNGFDFLGWHFKVLLDGRFRSTPSKKNYKTAIN